MSQTAARLVDHVIAHVPVRQWVLTLPIPLRVLLSAQPELVIQVLQVVQRVVTRHLPDRAGLKATEGHGGAVTLIQRSVFDVDTAWCPGAIPPAREQLRISASFGCLLAMA